MTIERLHGQGGSSGEGPERPNGRNLNALRQRSNQYSQAARDAIDRARQQGELGRQLDQLRNPGAQ